MSVSRNIKLRTQPGDNATQRNNARDIEAWIRTLRRLTNDAQTTADSAYSLASDAMSAATEDANNTRHRHYPATLVSVETNATDAFTFTDLPALYRVNSLILFAASTALSTATAGLRTAAVGGGSELIPDQTITAGASTVVFPFGSVAAVTSTASSLYFRVGTGHGSAATASLLLEITDLT